MNRKQRRKLKHDQNAYARGFTEKLEPVPAEEMPRGLGAPVAAWRSRKYLVQWYSVSDASSIAAGRLSICRSALGVDGRWEDKIAWDELQAIKAQVGFGDTFAVEIYPADRDLVNVANMRHLWLIPGGLPIGWKGGAG